MYVLAALSSETLDSWVWSNNSSIGNRNKLIKIVNPKTGNSIIVFKRNIDKNFEMYYNDKSKNTENIKFDEKINYLIINEYYRNKLDLYTKEAFDLEIVEPHFFESIVNFQWTHPNPAVQQTNRITLLSILLAILSIILTVGSFMESPKMPTAPSVKISLKSRNCLNNAV